MKENLILCGFMGCGKTTVGKRLAAATGREFIDMDRFIENQAGMTVSEIFAAQGEGAFRQMETEAARSLSAREGLVIASGGGTVLNPENVRLFRQTGKILLLDVPLSALQERLKTDTQRPLLQRPDRREFIEALHRQRMPLYRQAADLVVPAGAPARMVVERIQHLLCRPGPPTE